VRPGRKKATFPCNAEAKEALMGFEAFCLEIGLTDCPLNGDNNSIGVLSPKRPGNLFIFHSRKSTFCRAGSAFNMAAQFGNDLKYTAKRAEKGGVEAPRSITLSTPILLLSPDLRASGKPIFSQNASIAQQGPFFRSPFSCGPVLNGMLLNIVLKALIKL
jgi:hypothetical protein